MRTRAVRKTRPAPSGKQDADDIKTAAGAPKTRAAPRPRLRNLAFCRRALLSRFDWAQDKAIALTAHQPVFARTVVDTNRLASTRAAATSSAPGDRVGALLLYGGEGFASSGSAGVVVEVDGAQGSTCSHRSGSYQCFH